MCYQKGSVLASREGVWKLQPPTWTGFSRSGCVHWCRRAGANSSGCVPWAPLQVQKRRIYDITNVLEGIGLIEKKGRTTSSGSEWRRERRQPCLRLPSPLPACFCPAATDTAPLVDSEEQEEQAPTKGSGAGNAERSSAVPTLALLSELSHECFCSLVTARARACRGIDADGVPPPEDGDGLQVRNCPLSSLRITGWRTGGYRLANWVHSCFPSSVTPRFCSSLGATPSLISEPSCVESTVLYCTYLWCTAGGSQAA